MLAAARLEAPKRRAAQAEARKSKASEAKVSSVMSSSHGQVSTSQPVSQEYSQAPSSIMGTPGSKGTNTPANPSIISRSPSVAAQSSSIVPPGWYLITLREDYGFCGETLLQSGSECGSMRGAEVRGRGLLD